MPRLGEKYEVEVEEISQAREEYRSESYRASGLPPAPAVMMEDEVAGQGPEIPAEKIEAAIRRHLGLPPLAHSIENIPLGENHAQSQMFL